MDAKGIGSVAELARISGVQQPTVHRIISGETRSPRISTLKQLADALGIPCSSLILGGVEETSPPSALNNSARLSPSEAKELCVLLGSAYRACANLSDEDICIEEVVRMAVWAFSHKLVPLDEHLASQVEWPSNLLPKVRLTKS